MHCFLAIQPVCIPVIWNISLVEHGNCILCTEAFNHCSGKKRSSMKKKKKFKKSSERPLSNSTRLKDLCPRLSEIVLLMILGCAPLVFLRTGGAFENNPKMALLEIGIVIAILLLIVGKRAGAWTWKVSLLDVFVLCFYVLCWVSLCQAISVQQAFPCCCTGGHVCLSIFTLHTALRTLPSQKKSFSYPL